MRESRVIAHLAHRHSPRSLLRLSYMHFARPYFSWRDLSCISRTCLTRTPRSTTPTTSYVTIIHRIPPVAPSSTRPSPAAALDLRMSSEAQRPILRAYHRSTGITYMPIPESWIRAPGITGNITSHYRGKNYRGKLPARPYEGGGAPPGRRRRRRCRSASARSSTSPRTTRRGHR